MSYEYKNFLIKNFASQNVTVGTLSGPLIKGQLIGVDEHINLLLKNGRKVDEGSKQEIDMGLFILRGQQVAFIAKE